MEHTIETIYRLENPERNIIKFVTGSQLRYEDVVKEVFGVACIADLNMMIQYNKSFQTSVVNRFGVTNEKKISLDKLIRIASRADMLDLKQHLINQQKVNHPLDQDDTIQSEDFPLIGCPFDSIIQLQEGIYQWNDNSYSYNAIINGA
ncbi:hypothetical protein [Bacillus sp. USDA818B3_A]|uniref:hypothetical protein n=1 Tax=Bacillus sp. USDA818B3_A TaxID=2698834 RepID=UPI00136C7B4D|nr:hypothetical protein [Bacillus sp. USDA818B3_A]